MPVAIVTFLGLTLSCLFGPCHHIRSVAYQYPERCQYYDSANAPANKEYCDHWFATHPNVRL